MSEVHPSTTNPKVGEYYIERGLYNGSTWTIKITNVNSEDICYKIISSSDINSGMVGGDGSSITHLFAKRFRPLTPNEKVALL